MATQDRRQALGEKLLEIDRQIDWKHFFATLEPGASEFALENPYAFLMATCIDRGQSIVNWTVPFWLRQHWRHLDPRQIRRMAMDEVEAAVRAMPRRPRFVNDVPLTILDLTMIVVDERGGNARALWHGQTARDFRKTLERIRGVGAGIANMAVQLVNRVFPGELIAGGEAGLDIKADTHTRRVLYRLGLAGEESDAAAIAAARRLYPAQPGRLDAALWFVGKIWCHSDRPDCDACPLAGICLRCAL